MTNFTKPLELALVLRVFAHTEFSSALTIYFYLERRLPMSLRKSLSRFAAIAIVGCTSISAAYAANENTTQPAQSSESGNAGSYVADSTITAKVKTALMSKKLTGITVTTELGVVSLSGSVATETIRQQATQIAAAIDGVRGVEYAGLSVKMPS